MDTFSSGFWKEHWNYMEVSYPPSLFFSENSNLNSTASTVQKPVKLIVNKYPSTNGKQYVLEILHIPRYIRKETLIPSHKLTNLLLNLVYMKYKLTEVSMISIRLLSKIDNNFQII